MNFFVKIKTSLFLSLLTSTTMTEEEAFKKFEEDFEIKHFTESLVHLFFAQLGYERLFVNREKTTSALESINPNPIFNLLNQNVYVKRKKSKPDSTELSNSKPEDRREPDDSDSFIEA